MARVLLVSSTTGYQLRSFNLAAERAGVELTFATDRCAHLDDPWRDRAIAVRFHQPEAAVEAVAAASRERPFEAVLAVGDRPAVLAARVAEAIGIPGHPVDAAAAATDKLLTRERLRAAGLPGPWFQRLPPGGDPVSIIDGRYPCVLKPLGLSGSRGVIRADSPAEAGAACGRILRLLARVDVRATLRERDPGLLVEGFIDGPEFALEGVLTAGCLTTFAIFDKPDPLDGPYFEETIYVTPTRLPLDARAEAMWQVEAACLALGLQHGPVHAEFRMSAAGVRVLEVAPRPIGGLCSKVLRFAGGRSLEDVLLAHALDPRAALPSREAESAGVMMIPIPRRGLLRTVGGREDAERVPGVEEVAITAKADQLLEPLPEAGSYLGFIFARATTAAAVDRALREAHACLRLTVDPAIDVRPA